MWVCAFDECQADGDLGAETDNRSRDVRIDERGDGGMDVTGIRGEERAKE